jgi:hypothetical protein
VLRLLGLRRRSRFPGAVDDVETELLDEGKIRSVREAISQDWSKLVKKNLTSGQRKVIREHLDIRAGELKDLVGRNRDASRAIRRATHPKLSSGLYLILF